MSHLIIKRVSNHINGWIKQGWEDGEINRDFAMYKHALDDIKLIIEENDPCDVIDLIKIHIKGWNIDGWDAHEIGDDLAMYQDALNDIMSIIEQEEDLQITNRGW